MTQEWNSLHWIILGWTLAMGGVCAGAFVTAGLWGYSLGTGIAVFIAWAAIWPRKLTAHW